MLNTCILDGSSLLILQKAYKTCQDLHHICVWESWDASEANQHGHQLAAEGFDVELARVMLPQE
jgi:hypothetical protein